MIIFPNRYSTLPLVLDAINAGIPAYPKKTDKNEWIVEYDPQDILEKGEMDDTTNN